MTDAALVALFGAVPATIAALSAWRASKKADVVVAKADVIVAKTEEIRNHTNGAYQALQSELTEARKEIAALKALLEPKP